MKKPIALLLIIAVITCIIYVVDGMGANKKNSGNKRQKIKPYGVPLPQANSTPNPAISPFIKAMPNVPPDYNNIIANFPDLDRKRLERENVTLLPANQETQISYKEWLSGNSVEKDLYANLPPLFIQANSPLMPLDVNGEQRRVNFY